MDLADFVTRARTPVERDGSSTREILYRPQPEMPPRFVRQIFSLARGMALVSGHQDVMDEEISRAIRVGLDSIPQVRGEVLDVVARQGSGLTVNQVAACLKHSKTRVRRTLEELQALELVDEDQLRWTVRLQWRGLISPGSPKEDTGFHRGRMNAKQRQALRVLSRFPEGMQLKDWRTQAGLKERTSKRIARILVNSGHATRPKHGRYQITDQGREFLDGRNAA